MSSSIKRETTNLSPTQAADISRPLGSNSKADDQAALLARPYINYPLEALSNLSSPLITLMKEQDSSLLELPNDLFDYMFQTGCLNVEEAGVLRQSCKPINALFQDENETLFRDLIRRDFRGYKIPSNTSAQEIYKNFRLFSSNLANEVYASHTLEGHTKCLSSLATADGKIISSSYDCSIRVWDLKSRECLQTLGLRQHPAMSLAFAGEKIISGSWEQIRIWNLKTGESLNTLQGHTGWVDLLATAEGKIVSASNNMLKIWDLETGECMHTLEGHREKVSSLIIENEKVVSGSNDSTIKIWDLKTGKCLNTLEGHRNSVNSLAIANGKIISGSDTIKIWDLQTGECLDTLEGHSPVLSIAISGEKMISSSLNTMKIWDLKTRQCFDFLKGHKVAGSLAIVDGKIIASSDDQKIRIWDFTADDIVVFEEIANLFQSDDIGNALERFSRMPKKAREAIYKNLQDILSPSEKDFNAKDAFHDRNGQRSTSKQKAQAIRAYLGINP